MSKPRLSPDDILIWSGHSTFRDGNTEFENSYGTHAKASMMQAVMGQNGPTLEAESGSCLLIPIYVLKHKLGLLIHLWRDQDLSKESRDLIRKPFEKYAELLVKPIVGFVSSETMRQLYPGQIPEARKLLTTLSRTARFHDITAAENRLAEMGIGVSLNTYSGKLHVHDDYGEDTIIDYYNFLG